MSTLNFTERPLTYRCPGRFFTTYSSSLILCFFFLIRCLKYVKKYFIPDNQYTQPCIYVRFEGKRLYEKKMHAIQKQKHRSLIKILHTNHTKVKFAN